MICEECENCKYYWENQDDEYMNCDGEEKSCHEYIEANAGGKIYARENEF